MTVRPRGLRNRWRLVGLLALIGTFAGCSPSGCSWFGCSPDPSRRAAQDAPAEETPPAPTQPNILVVLVDTTRADHMHYLGYPRETTPHLDEFAATASRPIFHGSHSSRTGPSVASIFTGKVPQVHGVLNPLTRFDAKGVLGAEQVTLAERFKDAGYATYGVVTNINASDRFGFDQGFDVHDYFVDETHGVKVNEEAFDLIDGHDPADGPFFMYLHYMNPHSSYEPDPAFRGLFTDPEYDGPFDGSHQQLDSVVGGRMRLGPDDVEHLKALYDEEIRSFDERFGELLDGLGQRHLRANTIIVFVSDHGEEFGDHDSVLHGYTLYGEQLRVPLLIHDPRRTVPAVMPSISRHIDLMPTFLAMAGLEAEPDVQGVNLFASETGSPEEPIDLLAFVQLRAVKTVRARAIVHDGWKLIIEELPHPRTRLFHLLEDFGEQNDVSEEHPERVEALLALYDEHLGEYADPAAVPEQEFVELSEEEIEALRALGYIADEGEGEGEGAGEGEGLPEEHDEGH